MTQVKLPPHSVEAEQSLIGAALHSPRAYDAAAERITAEDFYREGHRLAWEAIAQVADSGKTPDLVTVIETLRSQDSLERAGGSKYLGGMAADGLPSNAAGHADIVRDHAIRRGLIAAGSRVMEMGYDATATPTSDLLSEADGLLCGLVRSGGRGGLVSAKEGVAEAVERLEQAYERGGEAVGLPTGFPDLDRIAAFRGGELVVIAGRPSMGKSAFASGIARRICQRGSNVAMFSAEMPRRDIIDRIVSDISGVRLDTIFRPKDEDLGVDGWQSLTESYAKVADMGLSIDDTAGMTVSELRARVRQKHRQTPLSAVIVDYLQLYTAPNPIRNREQEVAEVSRSLKALAKDLDIPVIALSQLSRKLEDRQEKRPRMSDLRESGGIEQDADLILFVYRDEVYDEDSPHEGITEIIIGKQRNGPLGRVDLTYLGDYTAFRPYAGPGFKEREANRPRKSKHVQFGDRKKAAGGDL